MIYLAVLIVSSVGIFSVILLRSILRSRNARRIVRSVKHGFARAEQRNAKWSEDAPVEKLPKSPRTRAVEMQQIRTLLKDAERAMGKRDLAGAELALIKALTLDSTTKDVKVLLAKVYLESKRLPKAEVLYRDLLQDIADASLYANLGLTCYKQQKFTEACKAYQEALNLDPNNSKRSEDLGRACIAAKRFREAVPLLKKAAQTTKDTLLLKLLAESCVQIGEHEGAEEAYRRINRLDPRDEETKSKLEELCV